MNSTFKIFYQSHLGFDQKQICEDISRICNVATGTVYGWALGYRTPRDSSLPLIEQYLRDKWGYRGTYFDLFPEKIAKIEA